MRGNQSVSSPSIMWSGTFLIVSIQPKKSQKNNENLKIHEKFEEIPFNGLKITIAKDCILFYRGFTPWFYSIKFAQNSVCIVHDHIRESGPIPDRVVMFSAINHGWAFKRCLQALITTGSLLDSILSHLSIIIHPFVRSTVEIMLLASNHLKTGTSTNFWPQHKSLVGRTIADNSMAILEKRKLLRQLNHLMQILHDSTKVKLRR